MRLLEMTVFRESHSCSMSNINDVLKIHEVSVLVDKVSTVFDKSEQAISNAKAALTDFDNDVLMDMLTAVQSYHQQSQPLLTAEQKQALKAQIKDQLVTELESKLNEQQITFILSVFEKLANTKKGAQTLPQ